MGDALLFKYNMIQPNGKWIDTNNIQHFCGYILPYIKTFLMIILVILNYEIGYRRDNKARVREKWFECQPVRSYD